MKKTEYIGVIIAVASLCLSMVALFFSTEAEPSSNMSYKVQADSTEYYRLYVMVNDRTVIATEDIGLKLYGVAVELGDRIRIQAYSSELVTVILEDASGNEVVGKSDFRISINHVVAQ